MRTVLKEEAESVQVNLFICLFNKTFHKMVIKIKYTFNDLFTITCQLVLLSSQNTEAYI